MEQPGSKMVIEGVGWGRAREKGNRGTEEGRNEGEVIS